MLFRSPGQTPQACPVPSHILTWLGPLSPPSSQNLLWAGSALLAPETGDLWAVLGQRAPGGSPGSAGLVQHLEEYAATLARNMELTYLNPVGLVTPNISMWRVGWGGAGGRERARTWRSEGLGAIDVNISGRRLCCHPQCFAGTGSALVARDRKSTRLNSSH